MHPIPYRCYAEYSQSVCICQGLSFRDSAFLQVQWDKIVLGRNELRPHPRLMHWRWAQLIAPAQLPPLHARGEGERRVRLGLGGKKDTGYLYKGRIHLHGHEGPPNHRLVSLSHTQRRESCRLYRIRNFNLTTRFLKNLSAKERSLAAYAPVQVALELLVARMRSSPGASGALKRKMSS